MYITDWFFSPQIYLRRPIERFPESRLDRVLVSLARKGVKIFILLYGEDPRFLYNGSRYVSEYLSMKDNNIMVKYHPKLLLSYWSHHEKQVIIDQCVMFMGGLDLCFG